MGRVTDVHIAYCGRFGRTGREGMTDDITNC